MREMGRGEERRGEERRGRRQIEGVRKGEWWSREWRHNHTHTQRHTHRLDRDRPNTKP